ncbi:MAG: HAD family hydrolase [Pseudomonadota bacterium]
MSPPLSIELITFDLDNTLWSVEESIGNAMQAMRRWLEPRMPGFLEALTRERFMALRAELLPGDPGLAHDLTRMRRRVLALALQQEGLATGEAEALADGATDAFLDGRHELTLYDNAERVLTELASRYTLAALSNGNADVFRLGLGHCFSFSCSAAEVGASKPAPAMFEAALARAGVSAQAAVHVGDDPVADIRAAAAVGFATVQMCIAHDTDPAAQPAPDAVVRRWLDLPQTLEQLGTRQQPGSG